MPNIIEFLEKVGQDSQLRHATRGQLARAFDDAAIAADVRDAALSGDRRTLEQLVGSPEIVCCLVVHSEESEEEDAAPARSLAA
jgi:hypothetical protein